MDCVILRKRGVLEPVFHRYQRMAIFSSFPQKMPKCVCPQNSIHGAWHRSREHIFGTGVLAADLPTCISADTLGMVGSKGEKQVARGQSLTVSEPVTTPSQQRLEKSSRSRGRIMSSGAGPEQPGRKHIPSEMILAGPFLSTWECSLIKTYQQCSEV